MQAFGEQQRRTRLEPVDARLDRGGGRLDGFLERGQVQRELNDRIVDVRQTVQDMPREPP
jgi:hypothetical protein